MLPEQEDDEHDPVEDERHALLCETHCVEALAAFAPGSLRRCTLAANGVHARDAVLFFLKRCGKLRELTLSGIHCPKAGVLGEPPELSQLKQLDLSNSHDSVLPFLLAAAPNLKSLAFIAGKYTGATDLEPLPTPHTALLDLDIQLVTLEATTGLERLAGFLLSFPAITSFSLTLESQTAPSDAASGAFIKALPASLEHLTLFGATPALLPTALAFPPSQFPSLISYSPFWALVPDLAVAKWTPVSRACESAGVRTGGCLRLFEMQERLWAFEHQMRARMGGIKVLQDDLHQWLVERQAEGGTSTESMELEATVRRDSWEAEMTTMLVELTAVGEQWRRAAAEVKERFA